MSILNLIDRAKAAINATEKTGALDVATFIAIVEDVAALQMEQATEAEIAEARDCYAHMVDGSSIDIDDDALVSRGADEGVTWVQAWVLLDSNSQGE